jgi:hypothetical protein
MPTMPERISEDMANLAEEAAGMFTTRTRQSSGESYVSLKDERPDWVHDAVRAAHGDTLPDDYIYSWAQDAFAAIGNAEGSNLDDVASEFAESVDVYTGDLMRWIGSHAGRAIYADETLVEHKPDTLSDLLMIAQARERRELFNSIAQSLADHIDE